MKLPFGMKRNLGKAERIIRVLIALAALASWYFGAVAGVLGVVAGVVAVMMLGTSAAASCPLHQAVGLNTMSKAEQDEWGMSAGAEKNSR